MLFEGDGFGAARYLGFCEEDCWAQSPLKFIETFYDALRPSPSRPSNYIGVWPLASPSLTGPMRYSFERPFQIRLSLDENTVPHDTLGSSIRTACTFFSTPLRATRKSHLEFELQQIRSLLSLFQALRFRVVYPFRFPFVSLREKPAWLTYGVQSPCQFSLI